MTAMSSLTRHLEIESNETWETLIRKQFKIKKQLEQDPFEDVVNFCQRKIDELFITSSNQTKCCSEEKHDQEKRALQEQLTDLLVRKANCEIQIRSLKEQLNTEKDKNSKLKFELEKLLIELNECKRENTKLQDRVNDLKEGSETLLNEYTSLKDKFNHIESSYMIQQPKVNNQHEQNKTEEAKVQGFEVVDAEVSKDLENPQPHPARRSTISKLPHSIWKHLFKHRKSMSDLIHLPETQDQFDIEISVVPTRVLQRNKFSTWEVTAIRCYPNDSSTDTNCNFLLGGSDNNVKQYYYNQTNNSFVEKKVFEGANGSITSIDYKSDSFIASSTDKTCRFWSFDGKLHSTLSGHLNKVVAVKFMDTRRFVVSGSHDRTLKLWDLNKNSCTSTFYADSSCNDVAVANVIASGHYDKKIRFWDVRAGLSSLVAGKIFDGKITSLSFALDGNKLLASIRDSQIALLDIRINQVMNFFTAEGFKLASDCARVAFSPDNNYIAGGSVNGSIYIWSTLTGELVEKIGENRAISGQGVTICSWDSTGKYFFGCDKLTNLTIWG